MSEELKITSKRMKIIRKYMAQIVEIDRVDSDIPRDMRNALDDIELLQADITRLETELQLTRDRCTNTELQLQDAAEKIRSLEAIIAAISDEPQSAIITTT